MSEFYFTESVAAIKLFYAPVCPSTNTLVRSLLPVYENTGPVGVYSFHQTQGRGQGSNQWVSEAEKNIAFTMALKVRDFGNNPILLNKAIALGVAEGIGSVAGEETSIKWPNDIMLKNTKTCGLLMEAVKHGKDNYLLAGIGINVNQRKWPAEFQATSISDIVGNDLDLIHVLKEVIHSIALHLMALAKGKPLHIADKFNHKLWLKNEWVQLETEKSGILDAKILEVDAEGRLVFETKGQEVNSLHHGEARIAKNSSYFLND